MKKNDFEVSILSSGDFFKKGYKYIADNIGKAVAMITLAVTALALFTDIGFLDFGSKSLTSTMALILTASYLMYFSMEDAGERLGEECEEYQSALKAYTELKEKIKGEEIGELRKFCEEYSLAELEYRKSALLMHLGYSAEEYEKYKSGELKANKRALRAFKKSEKLKAVSITPRVLLSKEKTKEECELKNPESTKLLGAVLRLIPCTVSMGVTVSVMLTAKNGLDAAAVINGLLKLAGVAIIGFKGYSAGYNYMRRSMTLWTETKSRLLEAFLKKKSI